MGGFAVPSGAPPGVVCARRVPRDCLVRRVSPVRRPASAGLGAGGWAALAGWSVSAFAGRTGGLVAGCVRFGSPLLAQIATGGFPGVLLGESIAAQDRMAIYRLMLALVGLGMMTGLLAWQVRRYASQTSTARAADMTGPVALAACLAAGALTVSLYPYFYPYSYFL